MKDYLWPETYVSGFISREVAHAIGVVSINWNWCEFILEGILHAYVAGPPRLLHRLTSSIGNRTQTDILRSIAEEEESDVEMASHLKHFADMFDTNRENRNLLIHGLCLEEYPDVQEPVLLSVRAERFIKDRAIPVEAATLSRVCEETLALAKYGSDLMDVGRWGEDGEPLPFPDKPSLPRQLTKDFPSQLIELLERND